jgi:hypothetical protein
MRESIFPPWARQRPAGSEERAALADAAGTVARSRKLPACRLLIGPQAGSLWLRGTPASRWLCTLNRALNLPLNRIRRPEGKHVGRTGCPSRQPGYQPGLRLGRPTLQPHLEDPCLLVRQVNQVEWLDKSKSPSRPLPACQAGESGWMVQVLGSTVQPPSPAARGGRGRDVPVSVSNHSTSFTCRTRPQGGRGRPGKLPPRSPSGHASEFPNQSRRISTHWVEILSQTLFSTHRVENSLTAERVTLAPKSELRSQLPGRRRAQGRQAFRLLDSHSKRI